MDGLISRTVQKHRPLSVHFDLTYRCNERCVHCYLDHDDHGELTTAECLKVLEDLARSGTLFLTFSGGEIFLRPDLYEILAAARRLHFDISLKSNALLVTAERAARLREFGVRRVQISVYSDVPAIHDAITKVPGSLERTLAAIPILLEHGLQVKLACPLMQENLMAYRGVMALAEKLGVPYILDLTITPMMDGSSGPLEHRASVSSLFRCCEIRCCMPASRNRVQRQPAPWMLCPRRLAVRFPVGSKARLMRTCHAARATIVVTFRLTVMCSRACNCPRRREICGERNSRISGTTRRNSNVCAPSAKASFPSARNARFGATANAAPAWH